MWFPPTHKNMLCIAKNRILKMRKRKSLAFQVKSFPLMTTHNKSNTVETHNHSTSDRPVARIPFNLLYKLMDKVKTVW